MAEKEEQDYQPQQNMGLDATRIRDLEEKQNVMRDRLVLIGKNLVDVKEGNKEKILEMRKEILSIKDEIKKIKSFLETISYQMDKFAKKDDLDILAKQAKMFQPISKKFTR